MKWSIFFFVLFYVLGSIGAVFGQGSVATTTKTEQREPTTAKEWGERAQRGEAGTQKQMPLSEREKARKEAAKKGTKVRGPNAEENRNDFFEQLGGQGRGGEESAGRGTEGQRRGGDAEGGAGDASGGQEGGKGGDMGSALQGLGSLLQGIAGIIGALKGKEDQDKQLSKQEMLQPSREIATLCGERSLSEVTTAAIATTTEQKFAGQRCIKGLETCRSEIQTADTGVGTICCKDPCVKKKETPQGKNAQEDIEKAKASEVAFRLAGPQGEKITSLDGSTNQDMRLLKPETTQITPTPDKIFVMNPQTGTNLYTLKGTEDGVEDYEGVFILDSTGIQKISVGETTGAITLDQTGILLWELPGTTVYDAEHDVYKTDSVVYAPQYGLWVGATERQQQNTPTGSFAHEFVFPTAGMTFGHGRLAEQLKNAIDASLHPGDADIIIYAKGYQDLDLLGNIGFFPLFIRSVAKGSTSVIYDRNVGVEKRYMIKDRRYEYNILREEMTTKVKTSNGKIIEDSGSFPLRKEALSSTQKRLLYERE